MAALEGYSPRRVPTSNMNRAPSRLYRASVAGSRPSDWTGCGPDPSCPSTSMALCGPDLWQNFQQRRRVLLAVLHLEGSDSWCQTGLSGRRWTAIAVQVCTAKDWTYQLVNNLSTSHVCLKDNYYSENIINLTVFTLSDEFELNWAEQWQLLQSYFKAEIKVCFIINTFYCLLL